MKKTTKFLAVFLMFAIVMQMLPANVFANDTDASTEYLQETMQENISTPAAEAADEVTEGQTSSIVVGEIPGLRSESEKHFRMSDGSYIAVDYGIPVHFSEDNGETWEDIDNTLVLSEASVPNRMQSANGKVSAANYTSENGANSHSFARDLSSGFLFSAQNGNHEIQMALIDSAADIDVPASGEAVLGEVNGDKALAVNDETADPHSSEAVYAEDARVAYDFNTAAVAEISYPDSNRQNVSADDSVVAGQAQAAEIDGTTEVQAETEETSSDSVPGLAEQVTPAKLCADVAYCDVFDGVDLLYELYSYNVKETILVKERRESYTFTFYMNLGDLTPEQKEDGSIELADMDGEIVYLIPAPYMVDANDAESDAVSYEITKTETGTWALTVTADAEWINSNERTFPVAIDPTVILYPYSDNNNILTSYVNSGRPTAASYNNTGYLRSGYYSRTAYDSYCTGYTVGLIYFNQLPKIPDNCVVTDAQLGLTQVKYGGLGNANYHRLYATTISAPSNPKTYLSGMTWNNYKSNILPYYASLSGESAPTALDYQKELDHAGTETRYVITNAVQRWYDDDDNSISRLLVLDDGHSNAIDARVTYGGYAYGSAYAPKIYVTYRNTVGIEGIYGYHTQNIGRAGTGYINDFTLQPTLSVPIITAPSNTLPFSISLVYNEALSYSHFTSDTTNQYSDASNIHTLYYTNAKTGYGWKTSVQQTVKYAFYYVDGAYLQYLVYTDADGTEHYFNKQNSAGTIYKDEDGLGLTITTYNTNLFTMKDKEGNTWEFTWGYLTRYADNNGNQLFYAYDGANYSASSTAWKPANNTSTHRVTDVWRKNDGGDLQKIATLTYSGEYLSTIKDAANRTTTLGYDNGRLVSLTFPDGKTASYSYSAWTNTSGQTYYRLSQACDNEANYRINYNYWGNNPLQLYYYIESTKSENDWITGQRVNCFQGYANYSRFRYFNANDYSGNGICVTLHYFDSWGRTVNVVTMNPEETEILGVSTGAYTANTEGSSKNNRLTNAASAGIRSTNLLQNAGIEHATNLYAWTKDNSGGSAAAREDSGTEVLVQPYMGQYLMKLYESGVTAGEYKVKQSVYLEAGKTYVLSAYVNTACTVSFGTNGGAYLSFLQGTAEKARSRVINYKTSTAIDGGWERVEVTFTPSASGTYAVAANINNISQIAVFDNFQLEKAIGLNGPDLSSEGGLAGTASAYNLLQAESFEFPNATTGAGDRTNVSQWWSYNSSQVCPTTAKAHFGSFGLTFAPSVTSKRRASQVIPINGSSNKTYILSGWGWTPQTNIKSSKEMEKDNENECRFFGLIAKVTYTDTSLEPDYHFVSFNDNIDQWQFASSVIVPKQRDKTVATITVTACLDYCVNPAYIDDISLIQEPVQTYDYDEDGNLISATNSEGKSTTTMDSKDRMTGYTAITGVSYELHYTGDSRNPDWVKSDGVTNSYTYDAAGNVLQTKTTATGMTTYLQSSATYDSTKNFAASATDVNNTTVWTNYSSATGLLDSSTRKNSAGTQNVTTQYDYNAVNRPTSTVQSGTAELHYSYDASGLLQQLKRKTFQSGSAQWQAYGFNYNAWGQATEILVQGGNATGTSFTNGKVLASYGYDEYNRLVQMTYANGDYVTYGYDLLDRVVHEAYYSSQAALQASYYYTYNSEGNLAKQYAVKIVNGQESDAFSEVYSFEYDSLGRLIRSREDSADGSVQRTEHLYDSANRLTSQTWTIGNSAYSESYTYNSGDGSLASMAAATGNTLTYNYDGLRRITSTTVKNTGGMTLFSTAQNYRTVSGNQTSARVQFYNVKNSSGGVISGWLYDYDTNGNIKKVRESLSPYRTLIAYVYDDQNQLTKETWYTYSGTSTTPSSTKVYTYTYDTAGNILTSSDSTNTSTYTYGDSDWNDLLTAYNGTAIGYEGQTYNWRTGEFSGAIMSGNPINWYNGSGTEYGYLEWEQGRRLSYMLFEDAYDQHQAAFEYDLSGVRTRKYYDSETHEYITQNGKVVRETCGATVLDFIYDANGKPFALKCSQNSGNTFTTFFYVLNLQGDVVGIMNSSGTLIVKYSYDAWGKVLAVTDANGAAITTSNHVAHLNPLRYRGYYYDTETGWYYLQSRYYDPIVKRFINSDTYSSTGTGFLGCNMFAYCENNPVNCQDPTGEILITTLILIGAAVIGAGVAVYTGVKAREAGCGWGETVLHSAMNGMMAFCAVYSFGMTAYGCYQEFCYLHGMTPITEIGGNTASAATIPQEAYDTYNYAQSHNGAAQNGYKGNKTFANDGRDGSQILPNSYAPFREYDIYPKTPGIDRGAERIVIGTGSGGAAWYTPNHYRTFIRMEIK